MIVCNNCHTENEADAVFCKQCGKRLDGKVVCPDCGKLTPGDGCFCQNCGADLRDRETSGKNTSETELCPNHDANSDCRQTTGSSEQTAKTSADPAIKKVRCEKARRFTFTLSGYIAAAGALFAFVFVFLIGLKFKVVGNERQFTGLLEELGVSAEKESIWYFFYESFEDAKSLLASLSSYDGAYSAAVWAQTVLSAVVAGVTLLSVVAFGAITAVKVVKNLLYGREDNFFPFALATVFSFLFGSVALLRLSGLNLKIRSGSTFASVQTCLTAPAVVGIVFSSVLTGLAVLGRLACNVKKHPSHHLIARKLSAALCVALTLVTAILAGNVLFTVKMSDGGSGAVKISASETVWSTVFTAGTATTYDIPQEHVFILIGATVAVTASLIVVAISVARLVGLLKESRKKSSVFSSAVIFALSAFLLAGYILIVPNAKTTEILSSADCKISIAGAIVLVVFSLLSLLAAILHHAALRIETAAETD